MAPNPTSSAGGGGRIRTYEGISQQIYSLPPLAAWVPLLKMSRVFCGAGYPLSMSSPPWLSLGVLASLDYILRYIYLTMRLTTYREIYASSFSSFYRAPPGTPRLWPLWQRIHGGRHGGPRLRHGPKVGVLGSAAAHSASA